MNSFQSAFFRKKGKEDVGKRSQVSRDLRAFFLFLFSPSFGKYRERSSVVERSLCMREVRGSTPRASSFLPVCGGEEEEEEEEAWGGGGGGGG